MSQWEKEKAYAVRRAEQLASDMDEAIQNLDMDAFKEAHQTAMRYMKRGQLSEYMKKFAMAMMKGNKR